jgi:hypothetical protein
VTPRRACSTNARPKERTARRPPHVTRQVNNLNPPCYFTGHWQLEFRDWGRLDGHLFLRVVILVFDRFCLSCLIERVAARMPVGRISFLLGGATEYASSSPRERSHIFFNGNMQDDTIFAVCHAKRHVPVLGHCQKRCLGNAQWSASVWALLRDARYQ